MAQPKYNSMDNTLTELLDKYAYCKISDHVLYERKVTVFAPELGLPEKISINNKTVKELILNCAEALLRKAREETVRECIAELENCKLGGQILGGLKVYNETIEMCQERLRTIDKKEENE